MSLDAEQALRIAQRLGIKWDQVLFKPADFRRGIKIEMEHSKYHDSKTSVIGKSFTKAGKIALAHLNEDFRYYDPKVGLPAFEKRLEQTRKAAVAKRKKALS